MKKKNLKLSKLKILIEGLNQTLQLDIESTNSLRISRLLLKLNEENELFNKERIKLCEKYAKKDENGKSVADENEHYIMEDLESFNTEFENLKNEEIEIEFKPIIVEKLPKIKPYVLLLIDDLLDE